MDSTLLRQKIGQEEFDYQVLFDTLREYSSPRDKISDLLRKGIIIRVKKGLYVFGEPFRKKPIVRELLANLIYGPSYLSLEYALEYHGLIPEQVETLTSVALGRSRYFETPVGNFSYREISERAFGAGMDQVRLHDGRSFLIATAEKALADKLVEDRGTGIRTRRQLQEYLFDHLRIDPVLFWELNPMPILDFASRYRSRKLYRLYKLMAGSRSKAKVK